MNIGSNNTAQQLDQVSVYADLHSLEHIRKLNVSDQQQALKKAAKEFEAFFLNMMLKSMRQASEVVGKDSPMHSEQEKMYVGMLDEQLAVNLSQKGVLGIADLLMQQLSQMLPDKQKASQPVGKLRAQPAEKQQAESQPAKITQPVKPKDQINASQINAAQDVTPINATQTNTTPTNATPTNTAEKIKTQKKSLFDDALDFINTLLPYAKTAAKLLKVDAKLLVAQAALETGWGKHIMHDEQGNPGFNLFGIKAGKHWQGEKIKADTLEMNNQTLTKVTASFRKYQSFAESFQDYVKFLQDNPRYQKAMQHSEDPHQYMQHLQKAGYATDPHYANKVLRIFQQQFRLFDD